VALVSGFSKNMLKVFLNGEEEEEAVPAEDTPGEEEAIPGKEEDIPGKKEAISNILTPRDVMEKAISGPEYEKLVVFD
jgi:hypothetical protein